MNSSLYKLYKLFLDILNLFYSNLLSRRLGNQYHIQ